MLLNNVTTFKNVRLWIWTAELKPLIFRVQFETAGGFFQMTQTGKLFHWKDRLSIHDGQPCKAVISATNHLESNLKLTISVS